MPIQRYRCADYGHRWSEHTNLNAKNPNNGTSQISVILQDAKNLTPTQKTKICAEMERHSPTENELKATPQIEKLMTQRVNDGRKPHTVDNYRKSFKMLLKLGADLFDPESTKAALAKSTVKNSVKQLVNL